MTSMVIAEIGSNPAPDWNFDLWCTAARNSGATHVKAQLFKADHFPVGEQASKRPLEFPRQRFGEFVFTAHRLGLQAGASVFDNEAVKLVQQWGDFFKLAAREQYNYDLTSEVFTRSKLIFRSVADFNFNFTAGADYGLGVVTLFAVQAYPAPMLRSIVSLVRFANYARRIVYRWGWSSHTRGDLDCRIAARLGAAAIEKHLCLSHDEIEGGHALTPVQFAAMARAIQGAER